MAFVRINEDKDAIFDGEIFKVAVSSYVCMREKAIRGTDKKEPATKESQEIRTRLLGALEFVTGMQSNLVGTWFYESDGIGRYTFKRIIGYNVECGSCEMIRIQKFAGIPDSTYLAKDDENDPVHFIERLKMKTLNGRDYGYIRSSKNNAKLAKTNNGKVQTLYNKDLEAYMQVTKYKCDIEDLLTDIYKLSFKGQGIVTNPSYAETMVRNMISSIVEVRI